MKAVIALALFCSLAVAGMDAQLPKHRDRIADGLAAAAITLPSGAPGTLAPADVEVLDDGRVAPVTAIVTDEPPALAILVDVAKGESAKVGQLLDLVNDTLGRVPAEDSAIRQVNQFNNRGPYKYTNGSGFYATAPSNRRVSRGGAWQPHDRPSWNAADWALASLHFRRSRRVLVVVTDGIRRPPGSPYEPEPGSERQVSFGDFRDRVRQEFATVFVLGVDAAELTDDHRKIAAESGGDARSVGTGEDLRAALARLGQEIGAQRVVYFKPANPDGRVHRLQVRLKSSAVPPQGPTAYLAPRSPR
jgi:hypothetical protein